MQENMQKKLSAGIVVIAILPRHGPSKRFVFKTKRFSALAKASCFLLEVVKHGRRERRRH
jgi:hypothetical protein